MWSESKIASMYICHCRKNKADLIHLNGDTKQIGKEGVLIPMFFLYDSNLDPNAGLCRSPN